MTTQAFVIIIMLFLLLFSALETFATIALYKLTYTIPYHHHHLRTAGEGHCVTPVPWPWRMADLRNVEGMLRGICPAMEFAVSADY